MNFIWDFAILTAIHFALKAHANDSKTTLVLFEDDLALVSYSYSVVDDPDNELKVLERSEKVYYCGRGNNFQHKDSKTLVKILLECLQLVHPEEESSDQSSSDSSSDTSPPPSPSLITSIVFISTNPAQFQSDYDESSVESNKKKIIEGVRTNFNNKYKVSVKILSDSELAFLFYVTNNVDSDKNEFLNRPFVSLTPAHFLVVYEKDTRPLTNELSASKDRLMLPDRLDLASKVYHCFGVLQFHQIYILSLALQNEEKSTIVDHCSSEAEYSYEIKVSNLCFDSEKIKNLPKKIQIKGELNIEECVMVITRLILEYSLSHLSADPNNKDSIFDELKKMEKPTNNVFISMDLFTEHKTKDIEQSERGAYLTNQCTHEFQSLFQDIFSSNDIKCFAVVYSSALLLLFEHIMKFESVYSTEKSNLLGGAMFLDPHMKIDSSQHLKWIVAIVFLTIIALISVTTLIVVLMVERYKNRIVLSQSKITESLWGFKPK